MNKISGPPEKSPTQSSITTHYRRGFTPLLWALPIIGGVGLLLGLYFSGALQIGLSVAAGLGPLVIIYPALYFYSQKNKVQALSQNNSSSTPAQRRKNLPASSPSAPIRPSAHSADEGKGSVVAVEKTIYQAPDIPWQELTKDKIEIHEIEVPSGAQKNRLPSAMQLVFSNLNNACKIYVAEENLLQKEPHSTYACSVITNAANQHLQGGAGVDGAIHEAGGREYVKNHRALAQQYNASHKNPIYPKGHAGLVEGGSLLRTHHRISHVAIVAGPGRRDRHFSKEQARCELYSCYLNSLLLAHKNNLPSIALPSISTGVFAYPHIEANQLALLAIYTFLKTHPDTPIDRICLLNINQGHIISYKQAIQELPLLPTS